MVGCDSPLQTVMAVWRTFSNFKHAIWPLLSATSGFWPRRARPCAARTRLLGFIATPNGALPIAASLLLIRPPKIFTFYQTWDAHVKGFFLSTGPQRLWNRKSSSLLLLFLFLFFLFFSTYPPLLISSYSSRRCYSSSSSSSFFDPFGLKFMYIPVRSYVLTIFVLFFFINIMSLAPPIAASLILTALY